ncbi:hypothetical protein [Mycobacterium uberis]|uniref:hypothetical protein n=1 Tax=Mycobacterium uberis TaxID=2162698 RepID=UPI0010583B8F|nr:hypothetical protein [Mycobacterium uberis]
MITSLVTIAVDHRLEITIGREIYAISPDRTVHYRIGDGEHPVRSRFVLAGVTPTVLAELLNEPPSLAQAAQAKMSMVLD